MNLHLRLVYHIFTSFIIIIFVHANYYCARDFDSKKLLSGDLTAVCVAELGVNLSRGASR